jgi:hypothetical protein
MTQSLCCALFLTGAALVLGGCSTTDGWPLGRNQSVAWNVDPKIPPQARVPQGHRLLGHAIGRGTGVYTLQADPADPDHRMWVQTGDEGGDLFDDLGNGIGHEGGNSWSTNNGNQVTGDAVARVPQHNGTQWALYRASSQQGTGVVGSSDYILQVHTVGGPSKPSPSDQVGAQVRAQYSADYYFYGPLVPQTRVERGGIGD